MKMSRGRRPDLCAVLFDLDGTLLDTAPDLVGALNHLRQEEGLPPVPVSEFRRFVSRGALGLIREGLPDRGAKEEARRRPHRVVDLGLLGLLGCYFFKASRISISRSISLGPGSAAGASSSGFSNRAFALFA